MEINNIEDIQIVKEKIADSVSLEKLNLDTKTETQSEKKVVQPKRKVPFNVKMGQFLYLSFTNFAKNKLWESASSCSFGFVFSFVPIVLILLTVLLSILRVSSGMLNYLNTLAQNIAPLINFSPIVENLLKRHQFTAMDFVLVIWVIWMARKLFLSIVQGMTQIFGSVSQRKGWFNQLLTFICEFALIFVIAGIIMFSFAISQLAKSSFASTSDGLPKLLSQGSTALARILVYIVLFLCTFLIYKFISGTKPSFKQCILYAAINTVTFFIVSAFLDAFINKTNYNILYGTLSTLILLMVKVYFFFALFLLYAQMIYVSQFFDQLLKSQLYFLPEDQDDNLLQAFTRTLFINSSSIQNEENTANYKAGEIIFTKGEAVKSVFYLRKGIIEEKRGSEVNYIEHGTLIGETLCILNEKYTTSAKALTNCEILEFSSEEFMSILKADSKTASLAVTKVYEYTSTAK